jgi:hypothetical protein
LFVHHLGTALADSGAGTDSSSGAGENGRDPNGGCVGAHDRWAAADSPRYTQPEKDHQMLLHQLHLQLPSQPSPRIVSQGAETVA